MSLAIIRSDDFTDTVGPWRCRPTRTPGRERVLVHAQVVVAYDPTLSLTPDKQIVYRIFKSLDGRTALPEPPADQPTDPATLPDGTMMVREILYQSVESIEETSTQPIVAVNGTTPMRQASTIYPPGLNWNAVGAHPSAMLTLNGKLNEYIELFVGDENKKLAASPIAGTDCWARFTCFSEPA